MGYDVGRFRGDVDEELLCPICSGVLEDPLQAPQCEHAFCSGCITEWLSRQQTCPVDRQTILSSQLKPVPRILRNLLSRLQINCNNAVHGCSTVVKLDHLSHHLDQCQFNPKRPTECDNGCGLIIPKDEVKDHNCVRELRAIVVSTQAQVADLQQELLNHKTQLSEQRQELQLLKDFMRAMRTTNRSVRALTDQMENDEVVRWAQSLQPARVTRWGGMISTPDAVLQAVIKRSLAESGCPPYILNQLMENAHERKWPPGLNTLETRQMNRRQYDNYVTKRVPGKQAVIVMNCDNQHVADDMILNPGLVMIFAHGIE